VEEVGVLVEKWKDIILFYQIRHLLLVDLSKQFRFVGQPGRGVNRGICDRSEGFRGPLIFEGALGDVHTKGTRLQRLIAA